MLKSKKQKQQKVKMTNNQTNNMFHLKFRPNRIEDFVGNGILVKQVCEAMNNHSLQQSILISGNPGMGKTTLARIIGNYRGGTFYELDAADDRGIDNIRKVKHNATLKSFNNGWKTYFFDEAHQMTSAAYNAMLKLLENPPEKVQLILATTNPEQIIKTVKQRCFHLKIEPVPAKIIYESLILKINEQEALNVSKNVLTSICMASDGSCREALVLLESVRYLNEQEALNYIKNKDDNSIKQLCQALIKNKPITEVLKIVKGLTEPPETIRRCVLGYMASVMSKGCNKRAYNVALCFSDNYFDTDRAGLLLSIYECYQ